MANIQKERELLTNEMNKFFQSPLSPYIYYCQFSAIQVILGGRCDQIVTGQGKFSQRMVTWSQKFYSTVEFTEDYIEIPKTM
jgi:hypothetical protein